ncbi:hypothetical protein F4803DRAFT_553160 [Xylaria telfairii]|nr:hypothetical protein F4803DRAFT_553160 [Xylaria telfairii]
MTQSSGVRQLADGSLHGTDKSLQTARTSIGTGAEKASSGKIRDTPTGNVTLVKSNLRSLPAWVPISDWLNRNDDAFPYGKSRANPSSSGG